MLTLHDGFLKASGVGDCIAPQSAGPERTDLQKASNSDQVLDPEMRSRVIIGRMVADEGRRVPEVQDWQTLL